MSRRAASAHPRNTKVTIPKRVGPHVKLVFTEMRRQNRVYDDVEEGSGVLRSSVKAWRTKNRPSLESLEAVLGYLGFDFVPIPRAKVMPPKVAKALAPIAADLGLTMGETIQALVEIMTTTPLRIEEAEERRRQRRETAL